MVCGALPGTRGVTGSLKNVKLFYFGFLFPVTDKSGGEIQLTVHHLLVVQTNNISHSNKTTSHDLSQQYKAPN